MVEIKTKCVNGELQAGDIVIATPDDEYACLVGRVINIVPVDSPDQDTDNETDDVYVDFSEYEYSEKRKREISETFSELYNEKTDFANCPLNDVIMAPCCLIRITDIDENSLKCLLESRYSAACYCYSELSRLYAHNSSEADIPNSGMATNNTEVPCFRISRTINGSIVDVKLTEQELLNAHSFQEKIYYATDIETILGEMAAGGKLSGCTADEIRADANLMKIIMDAYEEEIERYDEAWHRTVTEAINKSIIGRI